MSERKPVHVGADDYQYDGFEVARFPKCSGVLRVVVEDDNGRLFIHRPEQVKPRYEALVFIETRRTVQP